MSSRWQRKSDPIFGCQEIGNPASGAHPVFAMAEAGTALRPATNYRSTVEGQVPLRFHVLFPCFANTHIDLRRKEGYDKQIDPPYK